MLQIISHQFSCIATVKLLQASCLVQIVLLSFYYWHAFRQSQQKITCQNCGRQTNKLSLARHKKSCSAHIMYCTQCPHFSTKSKSDLNYHIVRKHSAPKVDVTFKCKYCYQVFPNFNVFRQEENPQDNCPIMAANIDHDNTLNDFDDANLKKELRSRQISE